MGKLAADTMDWGFGRMYVGACIWLQMDSGCCVRFSCCEACNCAFAEAILTWLLLPCFVMGTHCMRIPSSSILEMKKTQHRMEKLLHEAWLAAIAKGTYIRPVLCESALGKVTTPSPARTPCLQSAEP